MQLRGILCVGKVQAAGRFLLANTRKTTYKTCEERILTLKRTKSQSNTKNKKCCCMVTARKVSHQMRAKHDFRKQSYFQLRNRPNNHTNLITHHRLALWKNFITFTTTTSQQERSTIKAFSSHPEKIHEYPTSP